MKHLIFDFETLGTDVFRSVAIDCSFLTIDSKRFLSDDPYSFKDMVQNSVRFKLDVAQQKKDHGYTVDKDTLVFWQEQDKEVRKRITPKERDLTTKEFCVKVLVYLEKNGPYDYWWSRSNIFDPIFLQRIFQDESLFKKLSSFLHHGAVRDTRTYIDAFLDFPDNNGFVPVEDEDFWNKVFEKHNSRHDVAADGMRIQLLNRLNNDKEITKR